MGEVYLAEDARLGRKVALKLLPAKFVRDEERLRRFEQEARAASALNHPNIITIYEIGQTDSAHFIATELVEGETLRSYMSRVKIDLGEILDIAIQIASALAAAHAEGIVHRDIKPENVMLRPDGYVKVLDFGIAKLAGKFAEQDTSAGKSVSEDEMPTVSFVKTEPGIVVGSPSYMSPEQARGLSVDGRTDIFSLGVIIYEMIAGCRPFEGPTVSDLIVALLDREPHALSRYRKDIPSKLEAVVFQALAKDRQQRYQTAEELLYVLRRQKQRQEFEAGMEPSIPPNFNKRGAPATAGAKRVASETVKSGAADISQTESARTTAMVGNVLTGIKQSRSRMLIGLAALVVAVAFALAYWGLGGKPKPIDSLAVLPFLNESGDPNMEYLSDGITESLINKLSQSPNLKVMSRNSVFKYKDRQPDAKTVAGNFGVRAVLTGRITLRGDQLIVNVDLVDADDNSQVWGQQYNRKLSEIVATQEEIAKQIADKLELRLTGEYERRFAKHYTEDSEAYQLYLKGRYQWNKRTVEGLKKGIDFFNQAIEEDPGYALAHAGLADCYSLLGEYGALPISDSLPKARAAATRALELDDTLAEAHTSLAAVNEYEWKWADAEREYRQAIEMNPNYATARHWYAVYLGSMGRVDEGLAQIRMARELDPLSIIISTAMGRIYLNGRRYDEAIEQLRKTLDEEPDFAEAHFQLALAFEGKRMYEDAVREFQKYIELSGDRTMTAWVGRAYAVWGKRSEAERYLQEAIKSASGQTVSSYPIAAIYAAMGDKERALEWLEHVYADRSYYVIHLKTDPVFDSLRSDPRFQDLMRRIGFTP